MKWTVIYLSFFFPPFWKSLHWVVIEHIVKSLKHLKDKFEYNIPIGMDDKNDKNDFITLIFMCQ